MNEAKVVKQAKETKKANVMKEMYQGCEGPAKSYPREENKGENVRKAKKQKKRGELMK